MKNNIIAYALLTALCVNNNHLKAMDSSDQAGPADSALYTIPAGPLTERENRRISHVLERFGDTTQAKLFDIAITGETPDYIRLLVLRGADINALNITGHSSLELASGAGHLPVVQKLLDCGATDKHRALLSATRNEKNDVIKLLKKHGAILTDYELKLIHREKEALKKLDQDIEKIEQAVDKLQKSQKSSGKHI